MNHVAPSLNRKIPANGPRRSLERIGGPNNLPSRPNGLDPLEHHRNQRPRGDEVHKLPKEGTRSMLGVVPFGKLPLERHMTQSHEAKPLTLKASDDLASQRASKGIRLHKDQSTVHGFLFGCGRTAKYLTVRCGRFAMPRTKRGLRWAQQRDEREQREHVPAGRRPAAAKQAPAQPRKVALQRSWSAPHPPQADRPRPPADGCADEARPPAAPPSRSRGRSSTRGQAAWSS